MKFFQKIIFSLSWSNTMHIEEKPKSLIFSCDFSVEREVYLGRRVMFLQI